MSIDCFNTTNSSAAQVACSQVQEIPRRLSTTSLEVCDIETSGNNGVLDLRSTNSGVSSGETISTISQQQSTSKYAVLKRYQSIHLESKEIPIEVAANTSSDDPRLESENVASATSGAGTLKTRKYEGQTKCRFYLRDNYCKFGQNCRYLHEGENFASQYGDPLVSSTFDQDYPNDFDHNRKFRHDEEQGNLLVHRRSYSSRPRPVCRYFQYYGYCDYGNRCLFSHEFKPQTDRPKRGGQTPMKSSRKNLKENRSTHNVSAADNSGLDQNVKEISHVRDGDIGSPSSSRDIKAQPKKTVTQTKTEKSEGKKPICKFFKRHGSCKYEDRCTYSHSPRNSELQDIHADHREDDSSPRSLDDTKLETKNLQPAKTNERQLETRKPKAKKACSFFQRHGNCRYGDRCRYLHEARISESLEIGNENPEDVHNKSTASINGHSADFGVENIDSPEMEVEIFKAPSKPSLPKPLAAIQIHLLDQLSEEDLKALCQTEITQLKKRFPKCEVLQEDNSGSQYVVEFLPSDPDWPFEVKLLNLKVLFPSEYPLKPCFVEVVDVEDRFPETFIRYLDRSMQSWIEKRHDETAAAKKVEIVFKPYLRWLDRNLEDLFMNGLRMVKKERDAEAAGIEFVPYEKLKSASNQENSTDSPETEMFDNRILLPQNSEPRNTAAPSPTDDKATAEVIPSASLKRGTEVVLRNLVLGENAATLVCRKIALTLQCGRCKTRSEIDSPANRANRIFCTKCHHMQTLTYRPQLLHQFGCVLGYLDLAGCQVVDMPIANCNFEISCLQCSKNMPLNGLHYGQRNDNWCHNCNSKMTAIVESVKFHQLQPSMSQVGKGHLLKLEPKEKKVKDPAIQEGKPLPSDGTCKHFKKSYRWLRFPCCGKAYPCDICHDEKETDHDMKYATRMICGFCAKEQPYASEKPCVLCKSNMTKKSSTHWEGGKGCRDKTKMSRDDLHKYTGTSKTISRKVQEKTKPVAKK